MRRSATRSSKSTSRELFERISRAFRSRVAPGGRRACCWRSCRPRWGRTAPRSAPWATRCRRSGAPCGRPARSWRRRRSSDGRRRPWDLGKLSALGGGARGDGVGSKAGTAGGGASQRGLKVEACGAWQCQVLENVYVKASFLQESSDLAAEMETQVVWVVLRSRS